MIRERIISTSKGGGVLLTCPSEWGIQALMYGGAWRMFDRDFWKRQIDSMIGRGVIPEAAHKYALTMMTGGVSRSGAIDIIAHRDVAHVASALDIVDISEIPQSRTHRDAWRRSHNGGPIWIDENIATRIDEARMWSAYMRQK